MTPNRRKKVKSLRKIVKRWGKESEMGKGMKNPVRGMGHNLSHWTFLYHYPPCERSGEASKDETEARSSLNKEFNTEETK